MPKDPRPAATEVDAADDDDCEEDEDADDEPDPPGKDGEAVGHRDGHRADRDVPTDAVGVHDGIERVSLHRGARQSLAVVL